MINEPLRSLREAFHVALDGRVLCQCGTVTPLGRAEWGRNFGPAGDRSAGLIAQVSSADAGGAWVPVCSNTRCRKALYPPGLFVLCEEQERQCLALLMAGCTPSAVGALVLDMRAQELASVNLEDELSARIANYLTSSLIVTLNTPKR